MASRKGLPKQCKPCMPVYTPGTLALVVTHRTGKYGPYELCGPVPDRLRPDLKMTVTGEVCGLYSYVGFGDLPTCDLWPLLESADMEEATSVAHEIREELKRREARGESLHA